MQIGMHEKYYFIGGLNIGVKKSPLAKIYLSVYTYVNHVRMHGI